MRTERTSYLGELVIEETASPFGRKATARAIATVGLALALVLLVAAAAHAATLQPIGSFERPIYVTSDPGNPERLFVVERAGLIKQVQNGAVTTFADLKAVVGCPASGKCEGERGLLSIALAPDFDTTGRLYVDYVQNSTGVIHVAELVAVGGTALFSTPHDLLTISHEKAANHNGGQLQFGPEGNLFISTGDGGGEDDQFHNAQALEGKPEALLGKILRIAPLVGGGYVVPAGNPFPSAPSPFNTIWSYGLRNPYRFSFDRLSGAIAVGDVGQKEREEVDYALAPGLGGGANYGWNCREGLIAGPADDEGCPGSPGDFTEPIFDYAHANPGNGGPFGCAIVGGYVVRDASLGDLYGRYLYGDYCNPEVRSIVPGLPSASGDRGEGIDVANLVSFGEDSCGRIYTVSELGQVSRLVGSQPAACFATGTTTRLKPSFAGIKALRRRVPRGGKALITAFASPCPGRKGEPIKLFRNRTHIGTRHLDRACTARFRQKIGRPWSFRVTIAADDSFEAAASRKLKIKLAHSKRHHGTGRKKH
ncbi:MAG TPA: PQQ-dependent sugar dehydrogenase [Solirubrobacterales bacterium]|nr:PQQ-dependent sugar dehydrogenase [Solirubrobacterales bacterium]